MTLLIPLLVAIAKDIPKKNIPKPSEACPSSPANQLGPPVSRPALIISKDILDRVAASVCGLAVTSGSFVVGAICGVIVVYGVLKAQGK